MNIERLKEIDRAVKSWVRQEIYPDEIQQMASELLALQWQPITPENIPVGRDFLLYREVGGVDHWAVGYFNRILQKWVVNGQVTENLGWTHFRPINAPGKYRHRSEEGTC